MKRQIVLHVGFDKVGSSSIQTYLSNNSLGSSESLYRYAVLKEDGSVLTENLDKMADKSKLGYVSSYTNLAVDVDLSNFKRNLDQLFKRDIIPIFSSEGWARKAIDFRDIDIFSQLDVEATLVFYIRPQVDWLNSAWWQWFNWHPAFSSPQNYFNKLGKGAADWNYHISEWENVPNIKSLKVRLQHNDNVSDFLSLFGIYASEEGLNSSRSNVSLPPELVKLLCQYPEFRGLHDSHVDWMLTKIFDYKGKTPWSIDNSLASQAIEHFKESNLLLLERLDLNHREIMENDSRWWSAEAYNNKVAVNLKELILTEEEKNDIIKQMLKYVLGG